MKKYSKLKIAIIGAGSVEFCPKTVEDILLNDNLNQMQIEIALMDIDAHALKMGKTFADNSLKLSNRKNVSIYATTDLDDCLTGTDFVITAIEVDRYHYWSIDFHLPIRYGFRQVYGENGGPGGMFHTLRNLPPMLHIAHRMEALCPDAWLLNYTNPEAKLVEAISKLTKIKAVGICHGFAMGLDQIAWILNMQKDEVFAQAHGLNHFGWFTSITDKDGNDLYPLLKEKEKECNWLAEWDGIGLSRIMLRTYGLYPYPGTNHIGEYLPWSDAFLASSKAQFIYDFSSNPTGVDLHDKIEDKQDAYDKAFSLKNNELTVSGEYGVPIIEAIVFNQSTYFPSLNMLNKDTMPGIIDGMCVEGPCIVDGNGIHPQKVNELPTAITAMINTQGYIHRLLIEAYEKKSKAILLQAILLDPTISTYNNAYALIEDVFEKEKDILPEFTW